MTSLTFPRWLCALLGHPLVHFEPPPTWYVGSADYCRCGAVGRFNDDRSIEQVDEANRRLDVMLGVDRRR